MSQNTTTTHWARQIRTAWQSSVRSIIKCGQLLITAKERLAHGQFERMVANELPFGASTADRLMKIARDLRLTNPAHAQLLPPSWYLLYRLTLLSDTEFNARVADGSINPDMTRDDFESVRTYTQTIISPSYVSVAKPQPRTVVPVYAKENPRVPAIRYVRVVEAGKSMTVSETATARRRQAHRVIESLELLAELLADEDTAKEVAESLRTRGEDLFRVTCALQALADLKTAIDSIDSVQ